MHNTPLSVSPRALAPSQRNVCTQLLQALTSTHAIASLVGASGSGKTHITSSFVSQHFPDALHLEIPVETPLDDLAFAVAHAANVTLPPLATTTLAASVFARSLRHREIACVALDASSFPLDALIAFARACTSVAPNTRWICVSQHWPSAIDPTVIPVPELSTLEAVELLVDRIKAQQPLAHLPVPSHDQLVTLAQHLDGLPRSLEIAASCLEVMSVPQVIERLSLTHDASERTPQTLRASWNALAAHAQHVLVRLALLPDASSLEELEALIDPVSHKEPVWVSLRALQRASLVQRLDPPDAQHHTRFRAFESVRTWIAQQHANTPLAQQIEQQWALHTVTRLAHALPMLESALGTQQRNDICARHTVLVRAIVHCTNTRPRECALAWITLHVATAGRVSPLTRRRWLEHAEQIANDSFTQAEVAIAMADFVRLTETPSNALEIALRAKSTLDLSASPQLAARLTLVIATSHAMLEQIDDAHTAFQSALSLATQSNDNPLIALIEGRMGVFQQEQGHNREARLHCERALTRLRGLERPMREATIMLTLAVIEGTEGRLERASTVLERALELQSHSGDPRLHAMLRFNLGHVAFERDQRAQAEQELARAESEHYTLGNGRFESRAAITRGLVALRNGHAEQALDHWERARCAAMAHHDQDLVAWTWALSACAARLRGESLSRVQDLYAQATALLRASTSPALQQAVQSLSQVTHATLRLDTPAHEVAYETRLSFAALATLSAVTPAAQPRLVLQVGHGASWFSVAERTQVSLRKRPVLQRMLHALVVEHQRSAEARLSLDALVAAAWPGERMLARAAANRVYVAIRTLRSMGLGDVIVRDAQGYGIHGSYSVRLTRRSHEHVSDS